MADLPCSREVCALDPWIRQRDGELGGVCGPNIFAPEIYPSLATWRCKQMLWQHGKPYPCRAGAALGRFHGWTYQKEFSSFQSAPSGSRSCRFLLQGGVARTPGTGLYSTSGACTPARERQVCLVQGTAWLEEGLYLHLLLLASCLGGRHFRAREGVWSGGS